MTVTTSHPAPVDRTIFAILFVAAGCHLINDTMQAIMLATYPLLRDSYALTFTQVGLLTFAFQLTASVLQPLIGSYTDKHPVPAVLPAAPAFTLAGFLLLALAPSYSFLLLGAVSIGIGSAMFHPDASRISRLAAGGRFGLAQSLFQVGGNVGTSLGPLCAAAFILPHSQRALIWFSWLALMSIGLLSWVARWFAQHLSATSANPRPTPAATKSTRTVYTSLTILFALMLSKFVYTTSLHSFYVFFLMEKFDLSAQRGQIYLFILLAAIAVGTFAGGPIGDRIGRKAVICFSILGTLPFSLALPHANEFWTVMLTIPIGLILSSAFPAIVVYAQDLLPGRVGAISGLFFGVAFGLGGVGATALGALADATSLQFVFVTASFLPALGLLALLLPHLGRAPN